MGTQDVYIVPSAVWSTQTYLGTMHVLMVIMTNPKRFSTDNGTFLATLSVSPLVTRGPGAACIQPLTYHSDSHSQSLVFIGGRL